MNPYIDRIARDLDTYLEAQHKLGGAPPPSDVKAELAKRWGPTTTKPIEPGPVAGPLAGHECPCGGSWGICEYHQ